MCQFRAQELGDTLELCLGWKANQKKVWMTQVFAGGCGSHSCSGSWATTSFSQGRESEASPSWHFASSGSTVPTREKGHLSVSCLRQSGESSPSGEASAISSPFDWRIKGLVCFPVEGKAGDFPGVLGEPNTVTALCLGHLGRLEDLRCIIA